VLAFRSALRVSAAAGLAIALMWAGPSGSPRPAAASASDSGLVSRLDQVLRDSRVQRGRTSVMVMDAADGRVLYGRAPSRALIPASNTKILTAVAAMETLGPGYRFKTTLIRRGPVRDGIVQGNLYLKGYGDPTTRVSDFRSLARQAVAQGIKGATGRLVVDASYFDAQRYNPTWSTGYAADYYAGEISALTVAPNADYDSSTVYVQYRPGSRGKRAKITTVPAAATGHVVIANQTTTTSRNSRNTVRITRRHGSNTITVSGNVPAGRGGGSRLITVARPELYAAAVMRSELVRAGIVVRGGTTSFTTPRAGRTVLATDTSMPLRQLLVPFLKLSNNMHAEALTKAMSRAEGGPGSWPDGLTHTLAYLRKVGTPMDGVRLVDGSGLTRANRLTPRALATVLWKVRSEPWYPAFYAALPVAGNTDRSTGGTLRFRMNGTRAANNAHAKTGTLSGVTALSGYVTGRDGRRYVFSMVSNYTGSTPRPVENTVVVTLANRAG
jgi:D-alanyl-D-alanine carboxypeptidase/D-alanyl-D-alanine-endopeptidase (penicillin-binding protein 4)